MNRFAAVFLAVVVCCVMDAPPVAAAQLVAPVNAKVVPASMRAAISSLRHRTRLPILVPSVIDLSELTTHRVYAEIETANASAYTLDVDLAPGCYGVHACGYFALSAAVAGPHDGYLYHRRVNLGRGVDGDLQASVIYAYPTNTVISWRLGATAFSLSVNSHGPDALPLARSIVANLISVPRPRNLRPQTPALR